MKTRKRPVQKIPARKNGKAVSLSGNSVPFVQRDLVLNNLLSYAEREECVAFMLMTRFLLPMTEFMTGTYRESCSEYPGFNAALNENIENAVQGIYPALSVNYPKLLLTKGTLPGSIAYATASASPGKLVFDWMNNSGARGALGSDRVFAVAYCEALNQWIYCPEAATRKAGGCILNVPAFRGRKLQTYIGFRSADGLRTSNSCYAGMVKVL